MIFGISAEAATVLRRLMGYIRPYAFVLVPAGVAIVIFAITTATLPLLLEDVIDQLRASVVEDLLGSDNLLGALRLPLLIVVAFAVRGVMDFLTVYGLSWVGRSAIRDLRHELFRQYLYLPAAYYDRNASGDLISRLTYNSEQMGEALSNAVIVLTRDFLLIVVMFVVMLMYSLKLTLILAVVGPLLALLLSAMSRAFRRYSTRIQRSMGDVTRVAAQALRGQRIVKVFSGQHYEVGRFDEINNRNFRFHLRLVATRAFGDSLTQFIVVLGVAIMFFFVLSGWLSPGVEGTGTEVFDSPELLGFIAALAIMLSALKRLVGTNAVLQRGIAAAESLFVILDESVEPDDDAAATPMARVAGKIEFDQVWFRYTDSQDPVLRGISFDLEPGRTLAIVGRSGSGKSTLVSLLPRFYDPSGGSIRLDGRDLRDYPLQQLRRQIGFVSQDVVLFDDTIAGNIAYGALATASRAEIERAAEAAFVSDFAAGMPLGLDTPVGESGTLLSGGQRQRIAIARALLKDAPVLILDEATSALDSESERMVQAALNELKRGRTTLIIAHRLSTIEQADWILVMRDGEIVEAGPHLQLIAADSYYASLHRLQFAD